MLTYEQLIAELKDLCDKKISGTMFIKTQDNRSVRFTIEHGQIVNCCYRQTKGYDALPLVQSIVSGTFSFNEHPPLGNPPTPLPDTDQLIGLLSSKRSPVPPVQTTESEDQPVGSHPVTEAKSAPRMPTHNDAIFDEVRAILTDYIGPMASVLCGQFEDKKDTVINDVVEFEQMIDELALQIGNAREGDEFKNRILDMISQKL